MSIETFDRTLFDIGRRNLNLRQYKVEEVLPEVVYTDEVGMKSVSYGSIVGLLIEAIKEQNEQIKKLQS